MKNMNKQNNAYSRLKHHLRHWRRSWLCRINITKAVTECYNSGFSKPLDLENTVTINEKLQYLKLNQYYNNPIVTTCIDKYQVKEYLKEIGFGNLAAKLYGVYDRPEDIDWESLPDQFVVKCNHGCGLNILCPDKKKFDRKSAIKQLKKWMRLDYWTYFAEPQYKYIKKKILIEEYLGDNIHTYKFYCFNEVPKICYVSSNGENGEYDKYYDYFDMEWNRQETYLMGHDHLPGDIEKPDNFGEMKSIATQLCKGFPFVRIDLYSINGKVYFSEYTFIPTGGYMHLAPEGTDVEWGKWLCLEGK